MPQFLFDSDHLTLYQYKHPPLMQRCALQPADSVAICPINIEETMRGWLAPLARVLTESKHVQAYAFLFEKLCRPDWIAVYFVEVFGRNIGGGAKYYTKEGKTSFRLFDVVFIENFEEILGWPAQQIAGWRDGGGQAYVDADRIIHIANVIGFQSVPRLFDLDASEIPTDLEETRRFLLRFETSQCKLDNAANGVPEGVVVRSPDRRRIAKIRREDYERTLKRRKAK